MDRAAAVLFFKGKVDWQGSRLPRLHRVRGEMTLNGRAGSLAVLDEIAAWVNEGGAGDEVRR